MSLVLPDQGEAIAVKALVNHTAPQNLSLRLYKNDKTPADGDTEANYTVADFAGYASVTLTGGSWVVVEGAPTEATYAQQTFTRSSTGAAQTIYGYYLVQVTSGKLVWVERFASAVVITNAGETIKVTPRITAKDEVD